jgi:hypothetical protein
MHVHAHGAHARPRHTGIDGGGGGDGRRMPAILETARQRVETSAHEPSGCIISTDGWSADRYSASTCSRATSRRRCGQVLAQMWAGPGADVGRSRRRWAQVDAAGRQPGVPA